MPFKSEEERSCGSCSQERWNRSSSRFTAPPRIMDLGLLTRALKAHQVDLIAGNMTDGLIPALDLFVLEDDKHYFPPYEAVPVIREQTLAEHPEIRAALEELADKISDAEMRDLNYAVDGKKRDVKEVVSEFLRVKVSARPANMTP